MDFVFAGSFSNAILKYNKSKDSHIIGNSIMDDLKKSIRIVKILFTESKFPQGEALEIIAHVCTGFSTIIIREFGSQTGHITGSFGEDSPDDYVEDLSHDGFGELNERVFIEMNSKLKLFKED